MHTYNFVTPYYEPISGDWSTDPDAKFYPDKYDIKSAPVYPDSFYVLVNGCKHINGTDEGHTICIEFEENPTDEIATLIDDRGYEKHVAIFDSKIWDCFLNIPYAYPLGPVAFVNEFDILIVFYWYMSLYNKFESNDSYNWMRAAIDTVAYFGQERCINATNFYQTFLSNTIHKSAISNIKKFAKLNNSYDSDHRTLVYSLYSSDCFGGFNNAKIIK